MKLSLHIVAFIVAAFGLNGATPSEPRPDPIVIKIAEMNREFVHIGTPNEEQGAHLTFFFERKTKGERDRLFFRRGTRLVHVMDGHQLLAECRAVGISTWNSPKKARYGLILGFDSIEEAEQIARAIRPFLR